MVAQVYTKYLLAGLLAFVVTYLLTLPIARLAGKVGMIDHPGGRRLHARPTPLGGGVAVFLGFHATCAAMFLLPWAAFSGAVGFVWWWRLLPLSALVLFLGLLDDIRSIRPWTKLAGQTLVAFLAYAAGIRFGSFLGSGLPVWVDVVLTVFWLLVFVNAFNLIDGMDGLASGLGAIAAVGMAGALFMRRQPSDVLVLLGLAGACVGFLRFNFHPARIFLGDAGSMFIGFTLGAMALNTGSKGAAVAVVGMPLLAAGVPLFDTFLAVWRRALRGLSAGREGAGPAGLARLRLFSADRDHLHHRLIRRGQTQPRVAVYLYVLNVGLVLIGLLSIGLHSYALGIYMLAFIVGAYVFLRNLAYVELRESGVALLNGLKRPPRQAFYMLAYVAGDLFCLSLAALVTMTMAGVDVPWDRLGEFWVGRSAVWLGVPFLFVAGARTYSRVWSRARVRDIGVLVLALLSGSATATILDGFLHAISGRVVLMETIILWSLSSMFLVGMRAIPRLMVDMLKDGHGRATADDGRVPVLVYSVGYDSIAFFHAESLNLLAGSAMRIVVGIIDEDPNLHGRIVYGYRVLGGMDRLESALQSCRAREIVVAGTMDDARFQQILKTAARHNVRVLRWEMRTVRVDEQECSGDRA